MKRVSRPDGVTNDKCRERGRILMAKVQVARTYALVRECGEVVHGSCLKVVA